MGDQDTNEYSETRWPVPADPEMPSGGSRKALSRYITSYLSALRTTDPQLFVEGVTGSAVRAQGHLAAMKKAGEDSVAQSAANVKSTTAVPEIGPENAAQDVPKGAAHGAGEDTANASEDTAGDVSNATQDAASVAKDSAEGGFGEAAGDIASGASGAAPGPAETLHNDASNRAEASEVPPGEVEDVAESDSTKNSATGTAEDHAANDATPKVDAEVAGASEGQASGERSPPRAGRIRREEFIREQNRVFQKLSGFESYAHLSQAEMAADQRDKVLNKSLELYLAALDEKVYMSVCNSRASIGIRDAEIRREVQRLEEQFGQDFLQDSAQDREKMLRVVAALRTKFQTLWTQHSFLCQQRDQLETDLSTLRNDHALQLAKVFRLQYATQCLGKKLVEAERARARSVELERTIDRQDRELRELRAENDALRVAAAAAAGPGSRGATPSLQPASSGDSAHAQDGDSSVASVSGAPSADAPSPLDAAIAKLHLEVRRLKASEEWLAEHPPTDNAVATLADLVALIEINQSAVAQKQVLLARSFLHQYQSREAELLASVKVLEKEKQIVLARCEKLEQRCQLLELDLDYADKRSLSMVLMLKNMKVFLERE